MERNIPIYSHDNELLEWVDEARLVRLKKRGRVARMVKTRTGRVVRVQLHRMPGEPRPSFLRDYMGQKYSYRQHLRDGHRCYRLAALGDRRDERGHMADERNLAPAEVRPIFLRVLLDCLVRVPAAA